VFPSAGDDRWVAISCFTEEERARLHSVTGPDIATWTIARPDHAAAEELQAAGIAAGALQDCEDLLDRDPQLAGSNAFVSLDHALLGAFAHMNTPIAFSRDRFEPFRAPSMGEHTREVAETVAGLTAARFDELQAMGVFK